MDTALPDSRPASPRPAWPGPAWLSRLLFILMACTTAAGWWLAPRHLVASDSAPIDLEASLPTRFGDWRVEEGGQMIVKSAAAADTLDRIYDQHLSRTYVNSRGQRVMVGMAYGSTQTQQLRIHRQEVCYEAQGFHVRALRRGTVEVAGRRVPATSMIAVKDDRVEPVTYWFTMGDAVVLGYLDRQWQQLRYGLSGTIPDGYLFRVSTISSDTDHGFALQRAFAAELLAAAHPRLSARLLNTRPLAQAAGTQPQDRGGRTG